MLKFRSRLLFALISLIVTVLLGLGLFIGQLFESYYNNSFYEQIEKDAKMAAYAIAEEGIESANINEKANTIGEILNTEVTILDQLGREKYQSNPNNNILTNGELLYLLKKNKENDSGFHITNEDETLYSYGISILKEGNLLGYIILTTSQASIDKISTQIWGLVISSLGVGLVIIMLLAIKITTQYTKPLESATKVAMELAKGNYKARTYEGELDETGMLSQSINVLARTLQDMKKSHEMQQDRLQTLIENMGSGLLLIDSKGYIHLVNKAFTEIFQVNSNDFLYKYYYEAFSHKEVISLVEEIFMTEEKVRKQLLLPISIERKHFEVYGGPIIGNNDEWKGIVVVFHDITELKMLEQMRKDFVANVSHELRTPITSIKGFSETLLDGAMKDENTLQYFMSIILKESERMQSLIQDLLDLSKIEQHGFTLNIDQVDIKVLLEEVMVILAGNADEKNIKVTMNTEATANLFVAGDADRLKQVFINLISNSIVYTGPEGKVDITIAENAEEVSVKIIDSGIGIKEEEIPRIFERFYRVDRDRSRNSGGTGLGLAIVKHIIEAHHGHILVESKVGEGTVFTVVLKKQYV
ncbi:two-component system histidine kinase PnpS [Cytobacillus sp. Hm23]